MGSSGGGSGNPNLLNQNADPMPGLPVAGKDSTIGDPFQYGKFQSFLPDATAAGGPLAHGLTPGMFNYNSPGTPAAAQPGGVGNQIQDMRNQLAQMQAGAPQGVAGPGNFTPQQLRLAGGGNPIS